MGHSYFEAKKYWGTATKYTETQLFRNQKYWTLLFREQKYWGTDI